MSYAVARRRGQNRDMNRLYAEDRAVHEWVRMNVMDVDAYDTRLEDVYAHTLAEAHELMALCQSQLAYFKVPKDIYFLEELPKGPTGKILRRGLRA